MFNRYKFTVIVLIASLVDTTYTKKYELIHKSAGDVQAEIFNYHQIFMHGNILIELQTLKGDADMYVSETKESPTYDPHEYDLNSITCGLDRVEVPYNFKRPFTIGIYGHPSHPQSSYILSIYKLPYDKNTFLEDEIEIYKNSEKEIVSQKTEHKTKMGLNDVSNKIGVWSFFGVIDMITF